MGWDFRAYFIFFASFLILESTNAGYCCGLNLFFKNLFKRNRTDVQRFVPQSTMPSVTTSGLTISPSVGIELFLETPHFIQNLCKTFGPICHVYGCLQTPEDLRDSVKLGMFLSLLLNLLPTALLEENKFMQLTSEVRKALVQALLHMFSTLYHPVSRILPIINKLCLWRGNKMLRSGLLLSKLLLIQAGEEVGLNINNLVDESGLDYQALLAIEEYTKAITSHEDELSSVPTIRVNSMISSDFLSQASQRNLRSAGTRSRIFAFIPCLSNRPIFNDECLNDDGDLGSSCVTSRVATPTAFLSDCNNSITQDD